MKKTKLLLVVALFLQLFVTLGLGSVVAYDKTHDRAPSGLIIWGKDYSGMSRSQVFTQVKKQVPNGVSYKNSYYPLTMERSYEDIEKWLDQVFQVPTGSLYADIRESLIRPSKVITANELGLNREEIQDQLHLISKSINQPMIAARILYANGRLVKTDGQVGLVLDIEETWQKIIREHEQKTIELVVTDVPARPDNLDLIKSKDILGDYTTYFNSQDVPRIKNLRLAAMALDGQLIPPGQMFSYNDVVGERTEAAGYMPAFVFADNVVIEGIGGGICQDSSTLYQAVLQAHLPIVERHTHTLPVKYVLKGQDATVSYGILDFRFRNNTQGYILISARTGSNWLRIQLFGVADDSHPVLLKPNGYPNHPEDWHQDPK